MRARASSAKRSLSASSAASSSRRCLSSASSRCRRSLFASAAATKARRVVAFFFRGMVQRRESVSGSKQVCYGMLLSLTLGSSFDRNKGVQFITNCLQSGHLRSSQVDLHFSLGWFVENTPGWQREGRKHHAGRLVDQTDRPPRVVHDRACCVLCSCV